MGVDVVEFEQEGDGVLNSKSELVVKLKVSRCDLSMSQCRTRIHLSRTEPIEHSMFNKRQESSAGGAQMLRTLELFFTMACGLAWLQSHQLTLTWVNSEGY